METDVYDLVIRGGMLVDPERATVTPGNIGIRNGRIARIAPDELRGDRLIGAAGRIVCPGFIDSHAHIDGVQSGAELAALQGITTTVGGNCGGGPVDLAAFFGALEERGFPIHQAQFIGHSLSLRRRVGLDDPYLAATSQQIADMAELAEAAFRAGAGGLSLGLEYAPGSSFAEILSLSKMAARYGRPVAIHTRVLSKGDLDSLDEAFRIAEQSGAAVLVSHFVYQYGGGYMAKALAMVDRARQKGLPVAIDSGMYASFATHIGTPVFSEKAMAEFGWRPGDLLAATGPHRGRRLNAPLYHELRRHQPDTLIIWRGGDEREIALPLLRDYAMVSSDAGSSASGAAHEGHPQCAGNFPRFFRKLVREEGLLPLAQAVAKCTIVPARFLGLAHKGRLREGADADLVVFDSARIGDRAGFPGIGDPVAPPEGIDSVIVAGQTVVRDGRIIPGALPGKPLRAGM
ncbi:N-acyl-D-amino-acid deacylase [Hydrogenispora ethanolica]|uniref:N-acyl-D-amino-acid deacylase n=1 Tax=Hydrogenispora ethanolica TaxID=1082276 RepID=A0A4V2QGA9_HYDET|nr:amidohydrolase family protein [Hydrogenispora ethanolica]TCL75117.1 N-acyl-D-amino-acid deacylase [Hydrogenispora ethanolica]